MEHCRFLSGLILAVLLSQGSLSKITVEELEDMVFLTCNTNITWLKGTLPLPHGKMWNLGKRNLDPRGMYTCKGTDEQDHNTPFTQVYFRMCQNCVELDSATLAGIIITDLIATLLLALGVYCFSGHETGRFSKAADTQVLLENDQLYQPLRDRNDAQYSHLGENWPRKK
ncbi:T-cell surface glycoprotein CD3 delta chain isoform X1 [Meles meles]|uniref:T-cell surface glycoprotein CD3 delta chain isoform X1 n=1 Tax=Meles meles TaxID=9662 RepID=UPI001E69D4E2|nr:T-cell surface glycoprotein CD3 delta chain isoform X1 [Meles meles]